jgi:predicted benzoate:H+ symporter BenE
MFALMLLPLPRFEPGVCDVTLVMVLPCPALLCPGLPPQITYQEALAAVFIEGWIFIAISLTGVRGRLVSLVPKSIMLATAGQSGGCCRFTTVCHQVPDHSTGW